MAEIKIDLTPVLNKIGAFVKREAMRKVPVDQGELKSSIDYEVKGNKVTIFAEAKHAEDMEYGKPPEPLNKSEKDDLTEWAKRHNASPRKIIKYIEKHGIKVGTPEKPLHITSYGRDSYRPFLRPSVYQNIGIIKEIIRKNI